MIISNNNLIKVEDRDLDENGRVNIPEGIKIVREDAFSGLSNLTEITFGYGVEKIESYAFADLPNLKRIEFPSSLAILSSNVYGAPVFDDREIDLSLNSYPKFSKNCFGINQTRKYIEKSFNNIETILDSAKSIEDILPALECYNSVIFHRFYLPEELKSKMDETTQRLISKLSKKSGEKEIGQILVARQLKNGELLSPALLTYDVYKVAKHLKVEKAFNGISFEACLKHAMLVQDSHKIIFDLSTMKSRTKKVLNKENVSTNEENLIILHTLRHEMFHLYQEMCSLDSNDIAEQLACLDHIIQLADDGFKTGHQTWHIAEHDNMPDELSADIVAFDMLIADLVQKYDYDLKSIDELEKLKEKRLIKTLNHYGLTKHDDYRRAIMEEALNSGRLTESESEKLSKIYNKYLEIVDSEGFHV